MREGPLGRYRAAWTRARGGPSHSLARVPWHICLLSICLQSRDSYKVVDSLGSGGSHPNSLRYLRSIVA